MNEFFNENQSYLSLKEVCQKYCLFTLIMKKVKQKSKDYYFNFS